MQTRGGPCRGRLGRQEARREAVLDARRLVGRLSWAPGGQSGGRLGRQEARREAVLDARRPFGGRLGRARRPVRRVLGRQEAKSTVKKYYFVFSVSTVKMQGFRRQGCQKYRRNVGFFGVSTVKMQGFRRQGCTRRQGVRRQGCTRRQGVSGVLSLAGTGGDARPNCVTFV